MAEYKCTQHGDRTACTACVPTLRDRFAMAALTGFAANPANAQASAQVLSDWSLQVADIIMERRSK